MDVFLMPSLFEGLPVVGIEAQASGLPCVFSDTITDEIILSDRAVRLSLEQSDEVWAKELIRLGTADRDRAEGRSVVRSAGYDIVEETKRLQEIYVSLIEKQRRAFYCHELGRVKSFTRLFRCSDKSVL